MLNKKLLPLTFILSILFSVTLNAQSLLDDIPENEPEANYTRYVFKSTRIINTHSLENLHTGVLDFRILHRFGRLLNGWDNFFGLDQSSARIAFDYGITERLMVGIGRSAGRQEVDGFFKYKFVRQQTGSKNIPVTISYVGGIVVATQKGILPESLDKKVSNRTSYYHQILIGRKFSDNITIQVTPTYLHENMVLEANDYNDKLAIGFGGRFKVTKRLALMADYHHLVTPFDNESNHNPLSLGVDIETGGHVFQLHVSNSLGLNERAFLTNTYGDWGNGDFMFGFNISRTFQVHKPKPDGKQKM
jgi:hypothetical protein